jgi:hypothetical protein
MTKKENAAYEAGGKAFRAGTPRDANPHPHSDSRQICWKMGWAMAQLTELPTEVVVTKAMAMDRLPKLEAAELREFKSTDGDDKGWDGWLRGRFPHSIDLVWPRPMHTENRS